MTLERNLIGNFILQSRSSSSATSSSASKPDPDDIEEEDYEHEPQQQTIVINPVHSSRLQKVSDVNFRLNRRFHGDFSQTKYSKKIKVFKQKLIFIEVHSFQKMLFTIKVLMKWSKCHSCVHFFSF